MVCCFYSYYNVLAPSDALPLVVFCAKFQNYEDAYDNDLNTNHDDKEKEEDDPWKLLNACE